MTDRCSKCGERPRQGAHRWCRECQSAARAANRSGVSNVASNGPTVQRRPCPTCVALYKDAEMLRLEVTRLKGELADARKAQLAPATERMAATLKSAARAERSGARTQPDDAFAHGAHCGCIRCRSHRWIAERRVTSNGRVASGPQGPHHEEGE